MTYQVIVDDNHVAPQGKSINTEELELDPEITQLLHDENQMKIDQVSAPSSPPPPLCWRVPLPSKSA